LIRLAFVAGKGARKSYQPVGIGIRAGRGARDAKTRWQPIAPVLRRYDVRSVLDIGCAEGYFVRRAASELGCFAVGVEASDRGTLGALALLHARTERTCLMRAFVTPDELRRWPKFDAVICMSVVHHIIRVYDLTAAQDFIAACASRAGRVLIFEMGTGVERAFEHALPAEARHQELFVRALLEGAGLKTVRVIAETRAYHQGATRLLFAAEPAAQDRA
jgi:cyclopropane fatty-acyl-phospholipid synthase-like methyltransferase